MIALGFLLIVVGFAVVGSARRTSASGPRIATLGRQWVAVRAPSDRNDDPMRPGRSWILQAFVGLALMAGGVVIFAIS
jgi:hypothetical protein